MGIEKTGKNHRRLFKLPVHISLQSTYAHSHLIHGTRTYLYTRQLDTIRDSWKVVETNFRLANITPNRISR